MTCPRRAAIGQAYKSNLEHSYKRKGPAGGIRTPGGHSPTWGSPAGRSSVSGLSRGCGDIHRVTGEAEARLDFRPGTALL